MASPDQPNLADRGISGMATPTRQHRELVLPVDRLVDCAGRLYEKGEVVESFGRVYYQQFIDRSIMDQSRVRRLLETK